MESKKVAKGGYLIRVGAHYVCSECHQPMWLIDHEEVGRINFCPFCGTPLSDENRPEKQD